MSLAFMSRRAARLPIRGARVFSTSAARLHPQGSAPAFHSTTAVQKHPKPFSKSFHPETTSVFTPLDTFLPRHVGPREKDTQEMLEFLGYKNMSEFIEATVPSDVRIPEFTEKDIAPLSELELRRRAEEIANMNTPMKSYIGMG